MESLLVLDKVSYQTNDKLILKNISLSLERKKILTLLGPNGAGKSTLVKLVLGLLQPSSGKIKFNGKVRIGFVPQKINPNKSLPIKVKGFLKLSPGASSEKINLLLTKIGISYLAEQDLHKLSGGEMQRVLLVRALLNSPDLLVLDEPMQGVDVTGQAELYSLLKVLRIELNCAILLVSHDLHLVMAQTDYVLCLNQHICCHGTPEVVSAHPEYLSMFGIQSVDHLAIYKHSHDHCHELDGHIHHHDTLPHNH
ncbi:zinc ABC transporter ATP-binding protein ZnuC [Thorsellia anophelis]|uniref:Zinc transport system ATP-binding protein n=1 Tax=Thorsellia anophelis DSM 18579 TaxID=1123402 RepID=A0A1I0CJT5_9GAMM|nr:zinc ABC transporter ATP-binding protein ZnuC [Thorsellia anophelis]SET19912.1 zinc transport system ATP-binding protein [Thorsellia anophelis DSM 18579]